MCTHWPGAIAVEAKPMIWPNLRNGSPSAIGPVAILWPLGMRSTATGAPTGASPGQISSTATMTLSCGCRRRARGALMASEVLAGPSGRNQLRSLARERLELPRRLSQMSIHRNARRLDVACGDRPDDRRVLGERVANASWRQHQQA